MQFMTTSSSVCGGNSGESRNAVRESRWLLSILVSVDAEPYESTTRDSPSKGSLKEVSERLSGGGITRLSREILLLLELRNPRSPLRKVPGTRLSLKRSDVQDIPFGIRLPSPWHLFVLALKAQLERETEDVRRE